MNGSLSRLTRAMLLLLACVMSLVACVLGPHDRPDLAALSLALLAGFSTALLRLLGESSEHKPPPPPPAPEPPINRERWP